jgi:hypothetical protein
MDKSQYFRRAFLFRDGKWTESVAVDTEAFVPATKEKLGIKAKRREVVGGDGSYELREPPAPYNGVLGHENAVLMPQVTYQYDGLVRPTCTAGVRFLEGLKFK